MRLKVWLRCTWYDRRLSWAPADFGNITFLPTLGYSINMPEETESSRSGIETGLSFSDSDDTRVRPVLRQFGFLTSRYSWNIVREWMEEAQTLSSTHIEALHTVSSCLAAPSAGV